MPQQHPAPPQYAAQPSMHQPFPGTPAPQQYAAAQPGMPPQQMPPKSQKRSGIASMIGMHLAAKVVGFLVLGLFALIFLRGTTSATALETGDCFILPTADEISRVDSPTCAEPHDSQVIDSVEVPGPDAYPNELDPYWQAVLDQCEIRMLNLVINGDLLPEDTRLEILTPVEAGWNRGERETTCILHSPSGLQGSYIAGS